MCFDYLFAAGSSHFASRLKAEDQWCSCYVSMHYFLVMEVWQNADGIFLRQGKYAVNILNRLRMMECKAMATIMAPNLKLLNDASSESVDATMYR